MRSVSEVHQKIRTVRKKLTDAIDTAAGVTPMEHINQREEQAYSEAQVYMIKAKKMLDTILD